MVGLINCGCIGYNQIVVCLILEVFFASIFNYGNYREMKLDFEFQGYWLSEPVIGARVSWSWFMLRGFAIHLLI